ncbi:MAG: hypothetical protein KAR57_05365 [Bacteroidales bacterium]|nr:hypothetical protein [Bacteroidales bacterium]
MKKYLILVLFLAYTLSAGAQYVSDTDGGEWSDNATWTGTAPPYTDVAFDVTISSYVTSDQSITFSGLGSNKDTFTIDDTLIIYGDLTMGLDDDFVVTANAVLIIFGNFTAVNKATIENGGYFVVLGDFTMTGGAQTSYDNTGDGQTYVTGDVDVSGVGGGGIPELDCDPDVEECGYGDASDIIDDPIWDFIDEIDDGVSCSLSASGTATDESAVGVGDGAIDLTITSSGNPDVEWYLDGAFYSVSLAITDLNNDGDISGLSSGNYEVFITEGFCTVSLSFTVSVACTPPTITGTTPASRCGTGTVNLGATASAGTINWYDVATGGASLGTGTSFTTPSISATTTYYVDATDAGCTTAARTAVIATVNALPTANDQNPEVCSAVAGESASALVNLTLLEASINGGGGITYTWYSDAALSINITATANAQTIVKTINGGAVSATEDYYCVVSDGTCTDVATITYLIYRTPDTGPQHHIDDTWGN